MPEDTFFVSQCGATQYAGSVAMSRHYRSAPGFWSVVLILPTGLLDFLSSTASDELCGGVHAVVDDFGTLVPATGALS